MSRREDLVYRWALPGDQETLVLLKGKMKGTGRASDEWVARWPWQFVHHPWRPADCPTNMHVALLDDRIVGAIGCIPTYLEFDDRTIPSAFGCELFVDPDTQGLGLGQSLIDRIVERWPDSLWMNTPPAGARSYAKRGFDGVEPLNFRMLPADPGQVLRARGHGFAGRVAALAGPGVRGFHRLRLRGMRLPAGVRIEETGDFTPEVDEFLRVRRRREVVQPRRDAAFLQWRYRHCPFGPYTVLTARSSGGLVGYVVFRTKASHNGIQGIVNELEADRRIPRLAEGLLGAALGRLLDARAGLVTALPTEVHTKAVFAAAGFLDARKSPYVYVAPGAAERLGLPLDGERWCMSMGDCDVDFF